MDLELQRTCLNGFQKVLERTIVQEETLEVIVPDTCPDIMRMIDASGQIYVNSREFSPGNLRLNGTIRVSVLYVPDGEEGPRCTEVPIPFTCSIDDPLIHNGCMVHATPRLCSVDSRAINPRKLFTRAELAMELRIYAPGESSTCVGVNGNETDNGIQQKLEEWDTYLISALQEKSFTFSDVIDFPVVHARAKELLRSQLEARNLEAKIIGGKLIIKGEVELNALCREDSGSVFAERFHLPYSQVMELNGTGEDCDIQVECFVTALECSLQPGDPATIAVTLELLAQVVVCEQRTVSMLTDLYCIHCPLELERSTIAFEHLKGKEVRRENVRQFCECGIPAKNVVDTSVAVGRLTQLREGNSINLRAETNVTILFFSEDDALCSVTYPVNVVCTLNTGEEGELYCCSRPIGVATAVPVTGGLEVRFDMEFGFRILQKENCGFVHGVRELPHSESSVQHPSIILRMVNEADTLWDIAKAYNSTIKDIMMANGLERESAPVGKMLLIPRCR